MDKDMEAIALKKRQRIGFAICAALLLIGYALLNKSWQMEEGSEKSQDEQAETK